MGEGKLLIWPFVYRSLFSETSCLGSAHVLITNRHTEKATRKRANYSISEYRRGYAFEVFMRIVQLQVILEPGPSTCKLGKLRPDITLLLLRKTNM